VEDFGEDGGEVCTERGCQSSSHIFFLDISICEALSLSGGIWGESFFQRFLPEFYERIHESSMRVLCALCVSTICVHILKPGHFGDSSNEQIF
jgi:hypothetical protein